MKTTNEEILRAALTGYQLQVESISAKIAEIQTALTPRRGRKPSAKTTSKPAKKKYTMSAAGRESIRKARRLCSSFMARAAATC